MYFTVPSEFNTLVIKSVHAVVYAASSSGTPTIQIYNSRHTADVLSTRVTIDASELTSYTAATAHVVNTTYDDVATGDQLRVDVDAAGTGVTGLDVIIVIGS
jgi:hypothetical protein